MALMVETLPEALQSWVRDQAHAMGLRGPDSYILLLIRLEKQRQELAAVDRENNKAGAA